MLIYWWSVSISLGLGLILRLLSWCCNHHFPQDPVLFSGSLRLNLDPLDKYPDSEVWVHDCEAPQICCPVVDSSPDGSPGAPSWVPACRPPAPGRKSNDNKSSKQWLRLQRVVRTWVLDSVSLFASPGDFFIALKCCLMIQGVVFKFSVQKS